MIVPVCSTCGIPIAEHPLNDLCDTTVVIGAMEPLERRERTLRRALDNAVDGLLLAADSMEGDGCWCGGNWTGPKHHKYCLDQRTRVRAGRKALGYR